MASKRIDELTTRAVVNTDLLPPTPSGGPSGSATVAAVVAAGLSQPNSASAGAGANVTIKAADGVTSGAGGSVIIQSGAQATTGGNGSVILRPAGGTSGSDEIQFQYASSNNTIKLVHPRSLIGSTSSQIEIDSQIFYVKDPSANSWSFLIKSNYQNIMLYQESGNFSGDFWIVPSSNIMNLRGATFAMRKNGIISWGSGNNGQDNGVLSLDMPQSGILRIGNGAATSQTGSGSIAIKGAATSVSTNQNDLAFTSSGFQRVNCTSASDLTGIAPPTGTSHVDGRMIWIVNVGTATLTLKHNSASSTAANRMFCASGADYALVANAKAELVYDSTDNGSGAAGWRVYQ